MKNKKVEMKNRLNKKFKHRFEKEMPLIGGGDHDYKWVEENAQV